MGGGTVSERLGGGKVANASAGSGSGAAPEAPDPFLAERETMVREQIRARGVRDPRVLAAMAAVPRHRFLPEHLRSVAYADHPLPIGYGQTISQPYIVAAMAEALELGGRERVLEVGSGCGYMAAVLARLAGQVCGIELEPDLHRRAGELLDALGCRNVELACGDGALGWPERAPFDAVVVSCAAPGIPPELWQQLRPGGAMILPVGAPHGLQQLVLARKVTEGCAVSNLMPVSFVPLRAPGQ